MMAFWAGRCCLVLVPQKTSFRSKYSSMVYGTVYPSSRFDHVIRKYLSRSPSSISNYNQTEDSQQCLWRSSLPDDDRNLFFLLSFQLRSASKPWFTKRGCVYSQESRSYFLFSEVEKHSFPCMQYEIFLSHSLTQMTSFKTKVIKIDGVLLSVSCTSGRWYTLSSRHDRK